MFQNQVFPEEQMCSTLICGIIFSHIINSNCNVYSTVGHYYIYISVSGIKILF